MRLRVTRGRLRDGGRCRPTSRPAASVIIPTLKRKMATVAATESASAQGSTLVSTGMSKASPKPRTGSYLAEYRVQREPDREVEDHADHRRGDRRQRAVERSCCRASTSMKGAPRKIQRKQGVKVTQVASRPPSVPASIGDSVPGSRNAAMKPDELQHHDQRAGRGFGHAEAVEHLAGLEPAVVLDRLLGDIGEHRVGAAERHHRHLAEEDGDLAEDVAAAQGGEQRDHRNEPKHQPYARRP